MLGLVCELENVGYSLWRGGMWGLVYGVENVRFKLRGGECGV
jgi:hypothetical protein